MPLAVGINGIYLFLWLNYVYGWRVNIEWVWVGFAVELKGVHTPGCKRVDTFLEDEKDGADGIQRADVPGK